MKTALFFIFILAGGVAAAQDAQDDSHDLVLDLRQNWQEIEKIAGERDHTPAGEERDVLSARIARRARSVRYHPGGEGAFRCGRDFDTLPAARCACSP